MRFWKTQWPNVTLWFLVICKGCLTLLPTEICETVVNMAKRCTDTFTESIFDRLDISHLVAELALYKVSHTLPNRKAPFLLSMVHEMFLDEADVFSTKFSFLTTPDPFHSSINAFR
jgi:spore maturation protein SpmA